MWRVYWYDCHEMGRYLVRLFEYVQGWRDGQLFPRWAPDLYGGYGTPLFEFYSPFLFSIAGIPSLLGLDAAAALKIAVALFSMAGATGAFLLTRSETGRDDAGFIAAAAFVFAPYRFVDLYIRGDLAEYAALCLLPLVLWLYRELWRAPPEQRASLGLWATLAHAALILSHTILGQWGTELIAVVGFFSLWPALRDWDWDRLAASLLPIVFAVGLSAIYLLPALAEKGVTHMNDFTGGYFQTTSHLVPFQRFFYFDFYAFVGDGFTNSPNRMPFSIGIPIAIGIDIALVGALVDRRRVSQATRWAALTLAVMLLMTPWMAWLWPLLPFGAFVQFPWRLLGLVTTLGAVALGASWAAIVPARRHALVLAVLAAALIAWDGSRFVVLGHDHVPSLAQPDPHMTSASIQRHVGHAAGSGEHLPIRVSSEPRFPRRSLVETAFGPVRAQASQPRGTEYQLHVDADGPGAVDVQSFWFPGWRIREQSGPALATLEESPGALLRLRFPQPGRYQVTVDFGPTLVRVLATLMSLLSLALLWPTLWLVNRRRSA
ncbi:MAG: 6-pyruvoyl-tetrahydropterin synthase-related protein [Deltaproteobacteria bacterium]